MNIYEKLVEIRKNIEGFSKDTKSFNYQYVSGNQILRAIKGKMDELKVVLIPSVDYDTLMWTKHEYKNAKDIEKLDFIVQAKMIYKWINAEDPNDFMEVPWLMVGQQEGDISKAIGTALTYNERYFLLKQFGLPTDEDDADKKAPDYGGKSDKPVTPSKTATTTISEKQVNRLIMIGKNKGFSVEAILKVAKGDFSVNELKDLNRTQYDEICKRIESK